MADNQIKFYRGEKPADLSQLNPNAIYFFTDKKEIYTGGKTYGMSGEQISVFDEKIATLQGQITLLDTDVEDILKVLGVIEGYEKDTVLDRLDTVEEVAAANSEAVDAHEEAITNLTAYVGTIPEDAEATNVVAYVTEKIADALDKAESETAATVAAALEAHAKENVDSFEAVNAEIDAVGAIANAVKDDLDAFKAAAEVGDAAIDTLKEIQDYITSDGAAAAEMAGNITKAQQTANDAAAAAKTADDKAVAAQAAAQGAAETAAQGVSDAAAAKSAADEAAAAAATADGKAVAADAKAVAAQEAVDALEEVVDTKAAQADLNAAVERIGANEDAIKAIDNHSHANKGVLDGIDADKVAAWDAAENNAKQYADSLLVWNAIA